MASEGYAIKLRNRRRNYGVGMRALERFKAGRPEQTDLIRWDSQAELEAWLESERKILALMEGY